MVILPFIILPANVAFSELSKVIATASAAEVILTAVAIMSFTSAFLSAESVASRIIILSPATGVTSVSEDIPVAGNVFIAVWLCIITSMLVPFGGALENVNVVPDTAYVFLN